MPYKDPEKQKQWQRNWIKTHKQDRKEYREKLRLRAIVKLGGKCVNCGCDNRDALEFNHINGGGGKEYKANHRQTKIYLDIIYERRKDFELTCRVCNALHYLVKIKGLPNRWIVKFI